MRKLLSVDEFFSMEASGRIEYLSTLTDRQEEELLSSMGLAQLVQLKTEMDEALSSMKEELRKMEAQAGA